MKYMVTAHTDTTSDSLYHGTCLEDAKEAYERADINDVSDYSGGVILLEASADGDEWDTIHERKIDPPNKKSEAILDEVMWHYKNRYGNYKYNDISVWDDDDQYLGGLKLRIADHSENVSNNDRHGHYDYHISVVIADKDKTYGRFSTSMYERRKNELEFKFDSSDDVKSIISVIDGAIDDGFTYIRNKAS